MIESLPDRPLTHDEAIELTTADIYVVPAVPRSIATRDRISDHTTDLLVATAGMVATLAYDETDGWRVIAKVDEVTAFERVVDDLIAYRSYDISEQDREFISDMITERIIDNV